MNFDGNTSDVFFVTVSPLRECNLGCEHCCVPQEEREGGGRFASNPRMSVDQFSGIASGIATVMAEGRFKWADVRVVGGEPSMMGVDWWVSAGAQFRSRLDERGITYRLGVVSHLLSSQALRVAKLPVFDGVCSSYDVGGGRFLSPRAEAKWAENVRSLLADGIRLSVSVTITRAAVKEGARAILDRLYDIGVRDIALSFCVPRGNARDRDTMPSFHETSAFQIEGAKWLMEKTARNEAVTIYPSSQFLKKFQSGGEAYSLTCSKASGGLDINPDGQCSGCPVETGGEAFKPVGNVFSEGVDGVVNGARFRRSIVQAKIPPRACLDCEELTFCEAGCGILREHWRPAEDTDCPGFRGYLKFLRSVAQG